MHRAITELYYENLDGSNMVETGEDFEDYKNSDFNADMDCVILDFLDCYHHDYEYEMRDYLANYVIDYQRPEILNGITFGDTDEEYRRDIETIIDRLYVHDILSELVQGDCINIREELDRIGWLYQGTGLTDVALYVAHISLDDVIDCMGDDRINIPNKRIWDWGRDNLGEITEPMEVLQLPLDKEDIKATLGREEKKRIREFIEENLEDFVLYGVYTHLIENGVERVREETDEKLKSLITRRVLDCSIDEITGKIL